MSPDAYAQLLRQKRQETVSVHAWEPIWTIQPPSMLALQGDRIVAAAFVAGAAISSTSSMTHPSHPLTATN